MRNIYTDKNWLIDNLPEMIKFVGGYDGQWSNKFYEYWLSKMSNKKNKKVFSVLNNFINSKENYININHSEKAKKFINRT